MIHKIFPSTTAGYGSSSSSRNGATFFTRSAGLRMYISRESLLMAPESSRFFSRNFRA